MSAPLVAGLHASGRRELAQSSFRVLLVQADGFGHDRARVALEEEGDMVVVGECSHASEATPLIESVDPDIVFIDLDLPDGAGLALMDRVGNDRIGALIVMASSERHAFDATEAGAVDFLLKPIREERLQSAIDRARTWIRGRDRAWALAGPDTRSSARDCPLLTRLALRVDERVIFVRAPDIDFVECSGNYVKIHVGNQTYRLRVSLRTLSERLEPRRFRRIHRSSLVNLDRIREVQPWFGGDYVVILNDGRQLRASRTYAPDLLQPLQ